MFMTPLPMQPGCAHAMGILHVLSWSEEHELVANWRSKTRPASRRPFHSQQSRRLKQLRSRSLPWYHRSHFKTRCLQHCSITSSSSFAARPNSHSAKAISKD